MTFMFHLFLAQFVIAVPSVTSTNDLIRTCDNSANWVTPLWPANVLQYCEEVIQILVSREPEVGSETAPPHEFLPVGMAQRPYYGRIYEPVRTPWKISSGLLSSHLFTLYTWNMIWSSRIRI